MQFSQIIGQRELINKLTEIVDQNRVSHAQLFLGNSGFGTLPLAIAYAQYLNCTNKQHFEISNRQKELLADSCGKCPSCIKYERLEHPDLYFFFPNTTTDKVKSKNSSDDFQLEFRSFLKEQGFYADLLDWFSYLGVENKQGIINVRDANSIIQKLSYKSYEAQYKVVIIWMVEKLFHEAAPKLLKILEEPTEKTLFLLVAENQDKILKTILSRTQLVKVARITTDDLSELLQAKQGISPSDAELFSANSEGSYTEAMQQLKESDTRYLFSQHFVAWMRACIRINVQELNVWVEEVSALGREQQKNFFRYCLNTFRACLLENHKLLQNKGLIDFGDPKFNASFPVFITEKNIEPLDKNINETIYAIERNANPKILLMNLSFQIATLIRR